MSVLFVIVGRVAWHCEFGAAPKTLTDLHFGERQPAVVNGAGVCLLPIFSDGELVFES